jgi:hypothetical protein
LEITVSELATRQPNIANSLDICRELSQPFLSARSGRCHAAKSRHSNPSATIIGRWLFQASHGSLSDKATPDETETFRPAIRDMEEIFANRCSANGENCAASFVHFVYLQIVRYQQKKDNH